MQDFKIYCKPYIQSTTEGYNEKEIIGKTLSLKGILNFHQVAA